MFLLHTQYSGRYKESNTLPVHFDIIYTWCNDHDISCAVTKLNNKTIRHIDNILNNLKKTRKTGQNVGFKDILTSENPGNNSKNFNCYMFCFKN